MKKIITIAIFFLLTSTANAQFWGNGGVYNPPVASTQTFSAIPANTATDVQTAIKNASTYDFYSHTAYSIYSASGWTASPLSEVTLTTFTIPGGVTGANGEIEIKTLIDLGANTSNAKNTRMYLKTTALGVASIASTLSNFGITEIVNTGSTSTQISRHNSVGTAGANLTNSNVNTNASFTISIAATTSLETGQTPTTGSSGDGATCTISILPAHGYNSGEYIQSAGGSNCTTSGNPNGDPALISVASTTQFTYSCTCNGNMQSTFPTVKRYSVIQLKSVSGNIKYRP